MVDLLTYLYDNGSHVPLWKNGICLLRIPLQVYINTFQGLDDHPPTSDYGTYYARWCPLVIFGSSPHPTD